MSSFTNRFPGTRTFALAVLMGSTILAGSLGSARAAPTINVPLQLAQTTAAVTPSTTDAVTKSETIEDRITGLHTSLKITESEEAAWTSVAQAMRDNATSMDKLVVAKHAQMPGNMTAMDDLQTYQELAQAHVDGLKNLTSSFKLLYDAMPAEQQKNADQVFDAFGRHSATSHS